MIPMRKFPGTDIEVSSFGMGCMRFPMLDTENHPIDRAEATRMIHAAIEKGVTYFDTAYGYHNGESEIVTGLALKEGYREKVTLTTKLPPWMANEEADLNRLLDEQLKKLDVPYVDFYILHSLNKDSFAKLQSFHYKDFYQQALKDGRIKHTGFSFHDNRETFEMILKDYDQWELAQIQYNYLDDREQATEDGLKLAGKMGIPIVVMEPLRGGALATPPANVAELINQHESKRSAVEWAFKYVANYAEVATILSGMSTEEQLNDNLRIFDTLKVGSMTEADMAFVKTLKEAYLSRMPIKCTGCSYCVPCPQGVAIPRIFAAYNDMHKFDRPGNLAWSYKQMVEKGTDASKCVQCGACEGVCPQQLPIIDWLQKVDQAYQQIK